MLFGTLLSLQRTKRLTQRNPETSWIANYASGLQVGLAKGQIGLEVFAELRGGKPELAEAELLRFGQIGRCHRRREAERLDSELDPIGIVLCAVQDERSFAIDEGRESGSLGSKRNASSRQATSIGDGEGAE